MGSDPEIELTAREQEVLELLARGYLYKEIGVRLNIGVETHDASVPLII